MQTTQSEPFRTWGQLDTPGRDNEMSVNRQASAVCEPAYNFRAEGHKPPRGDVRQCDSGGAEDNSNSVRAKSRLAVLSIASVCPSRQSMYPSLIQRMNPRASRT